MSETEIEEKAEEIANDIRHGYDFHITDEMWEQNRDLYEFLFDKYELNTCSKCNVIESTYDFTWIDFEDFEPKEGEVVPQEAYEKYSALCEDCYKSILV